MMSGNKFTTTDKKLDCLFCSTMLLPPWLHDCCVNFNFFF